MEILIIAAHPDDEVLGMGATIKKISQSNNVHLCVVSEGASAQYDNDEMIEIRKDSCKKSGKRLGISEYNFLELPDMKLDTIPHLELNRALEKIIKKIKPEIVYTTPYHDLNLDHRKVFESTLIATRPIKSSITKIFSYEIPGPVLKPFEPNWFENIQKELKDKIKAFSYYESEVENFPHPRSIEAIENLAIQRGIESGLRRAEGFRLIRNVSN